jgi:dynein heavy chain
MLIFVDDLNMPTKETYGAQPPIEILRQFMFQGGWYERKTNDFRQLIDIQFIAAMGPPGGGKNDITARYLWHYNLIFVTPYVGDGLSRIFVTIMKWFLAGLSSSIAGLTNALVASCVDIYETVSKELLPTPAKSHYTFNLRDLGRVFQGCTLLTKDSCEGPDDFIKCWAHEVQRVFQDRLIDSADQQLFGELLAQKLDVHYKKKWNSLVKVNPLIWGDFMSTKCIYKEITDHEQMVEKMNEYLTDFNSMAKHPMKLVLFLAFCQHVARIVRVLRLPLGNALCVGVGGSGRKSVGTLAAFVVDNDLFQIEITKSYGIPDWQDDLKRLLMNCGGKDKSAAFLFSDTQVQKESFLEDIINILNTGEVPNLFNMEDKMQIMDLCTKKAQAEGRSGPAEIFAWFVEQCRKNCHIVICLSPIGDAFRTRLRNYPSLVNCCTIDWFMEWPREALDRVANQFLGPLGFEEKTLKGVVSVCVEMQSGVYKLTERWRTDARRHYYVTPTSYLELINSFQQLLHLKRDEVSMSRGRYDVGLDKIRTTSEMVAVMQKELEDLQPVLKKTSQDNSAMMVVIEKNQKEAAVTKANVEVEEASANEQAASANAMKADCQKDLDEAIPALNAAVAALSSLSKSDLVEVKAMKTPPNGVLLVAEALCIMFNVKPAKVKAPDGRGKVDDFWEPSKKQLFGDSNLLTRLMDYDKDNIPPEVMKKVSPFESYPDFMPEIVKKASVAACGICKWVHAMIVYDRVAKNVGPKKAALAQAEGDLAAAMAKLAEKKAELKAVEDEVQRLEDDLSASKQKQLDLEVQVEDCMNKLARAEKLIGGLGGERSRWEATSSKLAEDFINLTGDILVSSGIIAYLGVFNMQFRQESTDHWIKMLGEQGIPASPKFVLQEAAGEAVKIRQWIIDKLPNDSFSIDNGIILSNSRRWPLMIDPQLQANRWIRNMWSENIKVLRLSQKDYARVLETSISFGFPVLIENLGETLDPMLEPLLQKAVFKAGNICMIRLGDNTIEYSQDFRFFLTTKLPNPHYAPEVCVTVVLLNFVTTFDGLADQLTAILVAKEQPDMEKKRQDLVVESAQSKAQLKEIEDKILHMLSESKGNILDDEELINTLASSKITSTRIEERVVVQERTAREIQSTREYYTPVAERSSALFFVVAELASVESTYQYSLDWFVNIYLRAIETAATARGDARLRNLNKQFLKLLYEAVCRSLFEKDKLLYSMLLTIKMLEFDKELNHAELRLFLTGGGGGGTLARQRPDRPWMTDAMWGRILELERLPDEIFQNMPDRFVANIQGWEMVFDSDQPIECEWPEGLKEKSSPLEKGLILLALRADAVVAAIQGMVIDKLGMEFLEPPQFDIKLSYNDSTPAIPLVFVLTTGADPMSEIMKMAGEFNMKEKVSLVSLGQGQAPKAIAAINAGSDGGAWVVLQNCHLATSFMPTLESMVLEFNADEMHPEFRLLLTTMPAPTFPVSLLQGGIKITVEPPKGLKANLTRAYLMYEDDWMEGCSRDHAFRKMLFGLSFFHALILGRRKFGPLGWNIQYQFSDPDRSISSSQLKIFLDEFKEIPYEALTYMGAEANYGGRVTDAQDRRTIVNILGDFYQPAILEDSFKFSISGIYYPPGTTNKQGYFDYIKSLPLNETPEVYWLHQNADLTALINEGMGLLSTAVSMMPKGAGSSGKTPEEIFAEIAKGIEDELPSKPFDIEAVERKYPPDYNESLNTVLPQEMGRCNKLFNRIHWSIVNLQKAVKGLVVFSPELEEVGDSFLNNRQPAYWQKVSYPSLKPLGGYMADFLRRYKNFSDWFDNGPAVVFWLSGFFFTAAFLTGILQNMARREKVPIDMCMWNHYMQPAYKGINDFEKPVKGTYTYGLFMEGAKWDDDTHRVNESDPKVLFTNMPVIFFDPVPVETDKTPSNVYECPVYKTSARKGVLSTTGHSTNFVCNIYLPILDDATQLPGTERYWIKRGVALLTMLDT